MQLPLPPPLSERLAGGGVLVLGAAWTLGVALAHWDQIQAAELPILWGLLLTLVGGLFTVSAMWFGVGAVLWAMLRLLRCWASLFRVLLAVSAATPPLWVAAATLAAWPGDGGAGRPVVLFALVAILAATAAGFLVLLVRTLTELEGIPRRRAWICAGLTGIFLASLLSLQAG